MTVVVTGGAGFIGSHLVDTILRKQSSKIVVIDNCATGSQSNLSHINSSRVTFVKGDIRDYDLVENAVSGAEAVYHCAAAVGVEKIVEDPIKSIQVNIKGTENVLKAARKHEAQVFLSSSSEVYGKSESLPFSEADDRVLGPTTVIRWNYATTKALDEFMGLAYYNEYGLPVVIGRFFNIVGPRQTGRYGMVIPTFINQALANEPITVYGDGTQTRCFTHVKDATEVMLKLTQSTEAQGEVFNIGTPNPVSINLLATKVLDITNSDSEITYLPFDEVYGEDFEEPQDRQPDLEKLRQTLGFVPDSDLDRILIDTINEHTTIHEGNSPHPSI